MKKILFFCILPVLVIFFLFHYWLVGIAVYGDARYYWYFTRSLIIDHDLYLADEANHRYDYLGDNVYKFQNQQQVTPPGNPKDEFHQPIGTSIAWIPFFVFAHFFASWLNFFHVPILANGYSDIYQISVGVGDIFLVIFGLWLSYKLTVNFFPKNVAGIATLTMLFATNLFYYSSLDVVNSHAISFFLSSIFFYFWYKTLKDRSIAQWFFLGLVAGLLAETRTQDSIFLAIIIMELVWKIIMELRKNNRAKFQFIINSLSSFAVFVFGFFLFMIPQLLVWKIIYGGFFNVPYLSHAQPFSIFSPHILGVLANYKTGIIPYSPVIIPSVFGLFLLRKKSKISSWIFLIFFALEYYIIASWGAWDQASSYGIRMLISAMPVLILGCGTIVDKLMRFWGQKFIISFCTALILFNFFMIGVFQLVLKEVTYDQGKPTNIRALEKLNKVLHTNIHFFK